MKKAVNVGLSVLGGLGLLGFVIMATIFIVEYIQYEYQRQERSERVQTLVEEYENAVGELEDAWNEYERK